MAFQRNGHYVTGPLATFGCMHLQVRTYKRRKNGEAKGNQRLMLSH